MNGPASCRLNRAPPRRWPGLERKEVMANIKDYVVYNEEVGRALKKGRPVVAFESTIITYGLPYPENLKVARGVEEIARKNGAVPATISIVGGKIRIGADASTLAFLADPKNRGGIAKVSRHNMAAVIGAGGHGVTTVAGTMMICDAVGINVFVTGGIGGVHLGARDTFDISADLREFEKSKVAVVSSGVKSILDIKLTLEYLETCGVPIIGYKTSDFPAFYSRKSGFFAGTKASDMKELAAIVKASFALGDSGLLIANPVPVKSELSSAMISKLVDKILKAASPSDIAGPKYTPYILGRLHEMSEGKTLKANIALIRDNARVGSMLARELKDDEK